MTASATILTQISFLLFLLSGFCGLLYQVVWLRLAFSALGILTPLLSVVVSVFMLGLALGSWSAGRRVTSWVRRPGLSPIYFYAAAEATIGASAFEDLLKGDTAVIVKDDRPYNEYYLLRRARRTSDR